MSDWIIAGVSIVALAFSGLALIYSARQATEARRANDLLEQQLQREERQHQAEAVQWRVERAGDVLLLHNTGHETAHEVSIDLDDALQGREAEIPRGDATIAPGQTVRLHIPTSLSTSLPTELRVSWRGCSDPTHVPIPQNGF